VPDLCNIKTEGKKADDTKICVMFQISTDSISMSAKFCMSSHIDIDIENLRYGYERLNTFLILDILRVPHPVNFEK
jgi:hypothetical protein